MNAVATKPRAKSAKPTASVDTAEADFARGRDIAINMIIEGAALSGERDCFRHHRELGQAQDNFVNAFLADVIEEPALRGGFTAVLSQIVGSGETFDGAYFRDLTLAETQAGEPGADGTRADDEPRNGPAKHPVTIRVAAPTRKDGRLRDLLDQGKVVASLLFDIYSGDSSIQAPAESSVVETMIQLLAELLMSADERAEAISLGSDERDPIRQVRGLGEYLCAEATTKSQDHAGLRFGDRFASLCFWTVERRIDRAIEILTDEGGAA